MILAVCTDEKFPDKKFTFVFYPGLVHSVSIKHQSGVCLSLVNSRDIQTH